MKVAAEAENANVKLEAEHLPVTVLVPCFNEASHMEACLTSVASWAGEILVVDSYSSDETVEIASRFTDRILQHEYVACAAQKNWAIPQARFEWVFVLDCDERCTDALHQSIREVVLGDAAYDGYWVSRLNHLFGKEIHYSGWGNDTVLRLFRRDVSRYEDKRVHTEIQLEHVGVLEGKLLHYTVSSIEQWSQKINRYSSLKAKDKLDKNTAMPVMHLLMRPFWRFFKDFILRRGIFDGWRGFLIAGMSSYAEMLMAAKLVEGGLQTCPDKKAS